MAPKAHVSARSLYRLSVALILAALPAARNDALAVSVRAFPVGEAKRPEQIRLEFDAPVVVPGATAPPEPARVECGKGTGAWIDDRTWVYSFEAPLPGGVRCEFGLTPGFAERVQGNKAFTFSTGGPSVVSTNPWEHGTLAEDQILVVTTDAPLLDASIEGRAFLRIEGIASPVLLQRAALPAEALEAYFAAGNDRAPAKEKRLAFLRPTTRLPPGKRAVLVWDKGIRSPSGVETKAPQELPFTTRAAFSLRTACPRENARSGCVPIAPIRVVFNAEVPWDVARRVRLERADMKASGSVRANSRTPAWRGEASVPPPFATVSEVEFDGPFEPNTVWRVALPADFRDDDGRALEPLPSSAFESRVGAIPVLAKFPGSFGVVEAADPIVPLSLRAVEKSVTLKEMVVRRPAVEADPGLPFRWHHRLREHRRDGALFSPRDGVPSTRALPEVAKGDAPPRGGTGKARTFDIPDERKFDSVSVVGVSLTGRGLHLIELQSRLLGDALLESKKPMRVATGALSTDLAVHLKKGRSASLAWVTRLSTGTPVAGARVVAVDCTGKRKRRGTTDARGLATLETGDFGECYGSERNGSPKDSLFASGVGVVATVGDDFSFVHSGWDDGMEPWRFSSGEGSPRWEPSERERPVALVLDRALLRAGETLHASAFAWESGLRAGARKNEPLPDVLRLRHSGSDETLEWPLNWNPHGTASVEARLPDSMRKGTWNALLTAKGERGGGRRAAASANVRVEEFKVPTVRVRVSPPEAVSAPAPSAPRSAREAVIQVEYLSGGVPEGRSVDTRVRVEREEATTLEAHPRFVFASGPLVVGVRRENVGEGEGGSTGDDEGAGGPFEPSSPSGPSAGRRGAVAPGSVRSTLGPSGAARVPVVFPPHAAGNSGARYVRVSLEASFDDPAGERTFASANRNYAPASSVVGLLAPSNVGPAGSTLRAKVIDPKGAPLAGKAVRLRSAPRRNYAVRKKIFGGFYSYESYEDVGAAQTVCEARTDLKGVASCPWKPAGGSWIIEASHVSGEGTLTFATVTAWVHGSKAAFDTGGESDRIDLTPDKETYAPGDVARLRVAAPLAEATALVTVEAGEVLEAFVVPYSSREPFVAVPMKKEYASGATATVTLVRGRIGPEGARPGPGEIDVAKPTLRLGMTSLKVSNVGQSLLVRVEPGAKEYRVRDRGEVGVRVTTPRGEPPPADTRVTVFGVDEALLELQDNPSVDLLNQLLPPRGHEVESSTSQMYLMGRRHFGLKARPPGGGGGRVANRELFDTLLFWAPGLAPDATGRVTVPFNLNDSLTRFRVFAVASSSSARRAGNGESSIATRQDVFSLARVPLAVRRGDAFEAGFLVRNTSSGTLEATGSLLVDGAAVPVVPQRLSLAPGAETLVRARVVAHERGTPISLRFALDRIGGAGTVGVPGTPLDAVTVKVPVMPKERPRAFESSVIALGTPGAAGTKQDTTGAGVKVFAFGTAHGGSLSLEAEAAGPGDGARLSGYLAAYPYSCTEQLLSKAVVRDDKADWGRFTRELVSRTTPSGLVRYFPAGGGSDSEGDPWLTAYVLVAAHAWGRALPPEHVALLTAALRPYVARGRDSRVRAVDFSTRLLALEALVRHGVDLPAEDTGLELDASKLTWRDFASYHAIILHGRAKVPSLAAKEPAVAAALRSRLVRAGASLDLAAEPGLSGAIAQYARARVIDNLIASRAGSPTSGEHKRLVAEIARAHALATTTAREPGTLWSVWGLLAARRFRDAFPPVKGEVAWSLTTAGGTKREGTLPIGGAPLDAPRSGAAALSERARQVTAVFPSGTGDVTVTAKPPQRATGAAADGGVLLFTHARTEAPLAESEHRGFTARCSWSRTGTTKEGDVVTVSYALRSQSPRRSWVLFEIPLPPGSQILAMREGGGTTEAAYEWPSFVEKGALGVRAWYDGFAGGEAAGEIDVRLGVKGTFRIPGCHAEAVQEPDVSSTLPGSDFEVE